MEGEEIDTLELKDITHLIPSKPILEHQDSAALDLDWDAEFDEEGLEYEESTFDVKSVKRVDMDMSVIPGLIEEIKLLFIDLNGCLIDRSM